MNYQKIYAQLIDKRRINIINRTKENKNIEYHHIIPVSCGGINHKRTSKYNNYNYNIIGLTLKEHFFAHLLLLKIYQQKYTIQSYQYKNMLKAVKMMIDYKKYHLKNSRYYQQIKLKASLLGLHKTTLNRFWITNGKIDIFLKSNQQIPEGFYKGRTINFTQQEKEIYSKKISQSTKGRKSWNKDKFGIFSQQYRKKISENHADFSGQKNGRFGSRMMIKIQTQQKVLIKKEDIQTYLNKRL